MLGEAVWRTMDNFAFLLPVTMTLFGAVFLAIGWTGQAASRAWAAAFLLGAAGFVAPVLPMPVKLQALFANAVFLASFFYYGEAMLRHFRTPRLAGPRLIFALLAYAGAIVAIEGLGSLNLELAINDSATAILLGVPLVMVVAKARATVDRVLVAIAAVVVIDIVVRLLIFNVFVGMSDDLAAFASSTYTYYLQVSVGVLSVSFGLAALGSVVYETLERYRSDAERDPLTGLFNRRGFDVAVAALPAADRQSGVVLICDIDHFKQVNDGFGHAAGDLVLSGLADLLRRRLPPGTVIARFGGEEFVALLPQMPLASGAALAQSIRAEFSGRDWRAAGVEGTVTLCIGLAAVAARDLSIHDALGRADRALYAAKGGGRNQVMIDAGDSFVTGLRTVAPPDQAGRA
ncbi:GGDEF domain-containing protein [Nostoc sp. 3335mG]|nr:GGDEF domain-containing protein [Nostoc sp. 3335mG]